MRQNGLPKVRRCAMPIVMIHEPRASRAVVGFHGFTGYAGELALPAQRLFEAGFDVFVPRYPGHGTNGDDFLQSNGKQWLAEAERQYLEIAPLYNEVSFIGHSMGGIIGVILAQRHAIKRMVLYAPALQIPGIPVATLSVARFFITRKAKPWERDPSYQFFDDRDSDDDEFLGNQYWSFNYPRQIYELEKLRRKAVKALPSMETDTLVFTGGEDPTIPQSAGSMVLNDGKGKNNWVHLPKGTHLIPYDRDDMTREEAMDRTVSWLLD
jgi:carboxylesterase